jgi:alkylhydroperoxidase family enzyme
MSETMKEFDWADPILPSVKNPEWEAHVKKEMGQVPDVLTRVSQSPWLREVLLKSLRVKVNEFPRHLGDIGTLVCAQENACRFCYGIARSQMRLFGYSDKMISGIEQDMLMAEMDQKDRTFIRFTRSLARSNPRPPKAERDKLLKLGFSELAVAEMAFHIARECFINRIVTFISSPPMYGFERLPDSFIGRFLRPLIAWKIRSSGWVNKDPLPEEGPFEGVMKALTGIPSALIISDGLEGVFASKVLSEELKVLMFAVVARSLSCRFCHGTSTQMAMELGFSEEEFEEAISTLTSPRLSVQEQKLLAWTRETVHYQTGPMQKRVKALSQEIDNEVLLEAIGLAALANSVVRLAVLLE